MSWWRYLLAVVVLTLLGYWLFSLWLMSVLGDGIPWTAMVDGTFRLGALVMIYGLPLLAFGLFRVATHAPKHRETDAQN